MRNFIVIFLMIVLVLSACNKIDETREVYIVATGASYIPFAFLNTEKEEIDGFDIDLMKAVAKEANLDYKLELVSWDGYFAAMEKGSFDIGIYGITITEERAKKVDFSEPYYTSGLVFMVKGDNQTIEAIEDLANKNIGTVTSSTSEEYLRVNFPKANIITFTGSPELYMELRSGRIDAVLYDVPSINYFISTNGGSQYRTIGEILQGEEYGFVFPKGSPLVPIVNDALKEIINKGIYDDLYEKWFNQRPYQAKKDVNN